MENAEISCVVSIGYLGHSIVLHYDPSTYSFCEIYDPNGQKLLGIRLSCDIDGVRRAQQVIDAVVS